jgi:dihydrofolate synthase/folylpolyglutamate synthase
MPSGERLDPIVTRLAALHPRSIDLGLDRVRNLLAKLGNPERLLPPVLHVAGTNGKGSTCAFMRAILEADCKRVHVYTSPHLLSFTERVRLAGANVSEEDLAEAMLDVERVNDGAPITIFEFTTAVALRMFADVPANACILEVGLGGRLDATNVVEKPAACAITSISHDHSDFLGDSIAEIAGEKAGIVKHGIPVVTGRQSHEALNVIAARAAECGARLWARDREWQIADHGEGLRFIDAVGELALPYPSLIGGHQIDNAGIAVATIRASRIAVGAHAFAGIGAATWPGRLQRLDGRLAALLPRGWELWLDGGHNPGAGKALAAQLARWSDRPTHLVVGINQTKDAVEFLRPLLAAVESSWAVAESGQHLAMPIEQIVAASGDVVRRGSTVERALAAIGTAYAGAGPQRVLVCGSLYLAGEVLRVDQSAT